MSNPSLFEKLVPILHEDTDLIAVGKPAGMDAGRLPEGDRRGIAEILTDLRGLVEHLEPANRLSRYESGVLLLAKSQAMLRHIRTGLRTGSIQQDYLAVVKGAIKGRGLRTLVGKPGRPESVWHRSATGEKHGLKTHATRLKTHASHGATRRRADQHEFVNVSVLRRAEGRLLVRCTTNARSTHAFRATLRSAGLHVLGDTMGGRSGGRESAVRTCLHLEKIAFYHPVARRKITIVAPVPIGFKDDAEGRDNVERLLTTALAARVECLLDESTNAIRLINGDAEGIPGVVAEKFGDIIVLQVMEDRCQLTKTALGGIGRFYMEWFGAKAVYRKVFVKDRAQPDRDVEAELKSSTPMLGRAVEPAVEVLERGMKLEIRPYDGFAVGLFLDHRENRARVRELADGKRVLNLFAYTCGFSVAAALGGAASTVSVDISKAHLEWGKANFARNNIPLDTHQFIASDAFDYFKRARRQGRMFDLIIMDPPTFARMKKPRRTFSIIEDLPTLVRESLLTLDRRGVMMVSTNCRRLSTGKLTELVRAGGNGKVYCKGESKDHLCSTLCSPRRLRVIDTPPLPPDFAADPQHARTVFLRAD